MSAYPTSAQLAAFRRAIHCVSDELMPMHPDHGGAWPHEIRDGIGYPGWALDAHLSADARREASAMRSRAFLDPAAQEPWDAADMAAFVPRPAR